MSEPDPESILAERIAGEITLSSDPGATIRKWRTDFDITQTDLATELEVSASVISDYESGRRSSPGIGVIRRVVDALLSIDTHRGGHRIRQYARIISAGFENDIVLDLREYSTSLPLESFYDQINGTELVTGPHTIAGHTVIDSIEAITRLSSEEFYRLYGQSTNRALIFTNVSRGESPLVAMRVVTPTPHAVILHGLSEDDLLSCAPKLAAMDGFSLGITSTPLDTLLTTLRDLT
jgi:putative transcriptional regulator